LVARQLRLSAGTPVAQIFRVRLANGIPLSYDETYLPEKLGRKIMADDLTSEPVFKLLEEKYGTPLLEAQYQLEAAAADASAAIALGIAAGSPIFLIERTSYSLAGVPVDYEKLHYRGDAVRFKTRLVRRPRPRPPLVR
jgi:GntR family transcriptional regulator